MSAYIEKPSLGFGLGLRKEHYLEIIECSPPIDWFEIITENYLIPGGKPHYFLNLIRERYPIVMHGVSLSIGSHDSLDWDYLHQVKQLAEQIKPVWISDHLCFTGVNGMNAHDLLPLPYTEETIKHVVSRLLQAQDFLGRRLLIENVSSYLTYQVSHMTEWDFLQAVCEAADCELLLDINNIYVSSMNHEFNPVDYLEAIPIKRVKQIHLAGHENMGDIIIDTHDHDIIDPVWELYRDAIKRFGHIPTMIERDDNIPPLADLIKELNQARKIAEQALVERAA